MALSFLHNNETTKKDTNHSPPPLSLLLREHHHHHYHLPIKKKRGNTSHITQFGSFAKFLLRNSVTTNLKHAIDSLRNSIFESLFSFQSKVFVCVLIRIEICELTLKK